MIFHMKRSAVLTAILLITALCRISAADRFQDRSTQWKGRDWEGRIAPDGCLEQIVFFHKEDNDTVPFFKSDGQFRGPSFYAVLNSRETVETTWIPDGYLSYLAEIDGVECSLSYSTWKEEPALRITLTNRGHVPFQPVKAGLRLGIDTYMDTYQWFGKYFPTLMRNEKTHFFGYLQTPSGHMLGLVCPQPVASWSVEYNLGYQDPAPHWFMGHRIESLNIDLLNALTGEERWLTETLNAAGAFSNLIDYRTGDLRWAFVVDPYLRVTQACSADSHVTADSLSFGNPHPELYDTRSFIIGEQYVNMISDWQTVNTQDNDVHEVFKFIGEAMLTNAFIIERPDGTVTGYNCTVTRHGDTLHVSPAEKQITSLHCNLSSPLTVRFPGHTPTDLPGGFLGWL